MNPPALSVNKSTSDAAINKAFDDFIRNNYEKRISTLDAAKAKAEQAVLQALSLQGGVRHAYIWPCS